jgi:hypothetical protein
MLKVMNRVQIDNTTEKDMTEKQSEQSHFTNWSA